MEVRWFRMKNVIVKAFEEKGVLRWGLVYSDDRDRERLYEEDWKQAIFDSEEAAKAKLESIETEHQHEKQAIPMSYDDAKAFADSHKWKFATTYAKTAPHEYLVKRWLSEDDKRQFERLVQTINKDSVVGYFYGHKNQYLILGDYYYWYMPCYPENMAVDLINRTTIDNLEYRDGAYYYIGKQEK